MLGPLLAMPSGQGLNMPLLAILKVNGANWLLVLEKNWSCGKMFLLLTRYHYWLDNTMYFVYWSMRVFDSVQPGSLTQHLRRKSWSKDDPAEKNNLIWNNATINYYYIDMFSEKKLIVFAWYCIWCNYLKLLFKDIWNYIGQTIMFWNMTLMHRLSMCADRTGNLRLCIPKYLRIKHENIMLTTISPRISLEPNGTSFSTVILISSSGGWYWVLRPVRRCADHVQRHACDSKPSDCHRGHWAFAAGCLRL